MIYQMMTRIVSLLFIYSSLNFCCYGNLDKCDGDGVLFTFKCDGDKDRTDGSDEDYFNKNDGSRVVSAKFIALLVISFIVSASTRPYRNRPRERLVDLRMGIQIIIKNIIYDAFIKGNDVQVDRLLVLIVPVCRYLYYLYYLDYRTDTFTTAKDMLEIQLLIFGIAWLPCLVRPLRINIARFSVCFFHFLLIFCLRDWHFSNIMLANAHFLFVALRNSSHTLIIFVLTLIYYLLI